MSDFWIVTSHKFVRHPSFEAAETERARISAKVPDKTFAVMRCKENVQPTPVFHEMLAALRKAHTIALHSTAPGAGEFVDDVAYLVAKAEGRTP